MEMQVGDYNVLESGSIVCMDGYPVIFTFGKLTYKIVLHKDLNASEKGNSVEFLLNSKNMDLAEIHLYLKDSVALASENPYRVGNYNGRSLSIAFHIDNFISMSDTSMPIVLNYTWLQRDTEIVFKHTGAGEVNIEEK